MAKIKIVIFLVMEEDEDTLPEILRAMSIDILIYQYNLIY